MESQSAPGKFQRWIAATISVALLFVLVLFFSERTPPDVMKAPANTMTSALPSQVKASSITAPRKSPDTAGRTDLCGMGMVSIDPDDGKALWDYLDAATRKGWDHWSAALTDSGSLEARAVGLLLNTKFPGTDVSAPVSEQARDDLVQLAAGSGDPAVYALAYYECNLDAQGPPGGACQRISLKRWTQIDSDNAVPWLLLAAKAHANNNTAEESEAYSRAVQARRMDAYVDSLYAFSAADLPSDASSLERFYFGLKLSGIEAVIRPPYFAVASRHCAADAMHDGRLRHECSALAESFVNHGTNLIDFGIGVGIGARTGWPEERVAGLALRRDSLKQALSQTWPPEDSQKWNCAGVAIGSIFIEKQARLGELGAARAALEESGETVEALAAKYTARVDKLVHESQSKTPRQPDAPAGDAAGQD
jgi:hypothetical protein